MPQRATLVPEVSSGAVHMVLDDFGKLGRAWREMDEQKTSKQDVVHEIIDGVYNRPIKIVAFDLEDPVWVRDVTEDIAWAVIETARAEDLVLGNVAVQFVERVTGKDVPANLLGTA
jgi:hypothetical protein